MGLVVNTSYAQQQNQQPQQQKYIQFSGLILSYDSIKPVPFASVRVKNSYRGVNANVQGFFSFVVMENDVVEVSCIGYKKKTIKIPTGLKEPQYTILVILPTDTITLKQVNIYPWPSKAKFKEAFLNTQVPKTYYEIAQENVDRATLRRLLLNMKMDGTENQKMFMNKMVQNAYMYGGQANYVVFPGANTAVPLSLLNPMAWAQFISDLMAGKIWKQE